MKQYKLKLTAETAQLIKNLHPYLKGKIQAALQSIIADPHVGKSLKEELTGLKSFRVKRFRIIYRLEKNCIEIITLGPRRIIYEETFRLISREQRRTND